MTICITSPGKLVNWTVRIAILGSFGLIGIATGGVEVFSGVSNAQDGFPGGRGGKGQPGMKGQLKGGPPGFGGYGMMSDGIDSVKTQIKATDEEWKVIGPKLREVVAARRAAEIGFGDNLGSRGGFGGPGGGFGPPGGPGGFGPGGGGFPPGGPGGFGPPGGPGGSPPGGPSGGGFPPDGPSDGGPPGRPGGVQPSAAEASPLSILDLLRLTAEQKPQVETLQKELDTKLAKVLTEEQNKQLKDTRDGRGGFGLMTPAGPILFQINLDRLKLTAEQKSQVETIQKEIDTKFAKVLTQEQNKQLASMRESVDRAGQGSGPGVRAAAPGLTGGGPPGFGGGGRPGFGGGGPPGFVGGGGGGDSVVNQALNELQTAIDDPKTTPAQLSEKVAAVRAARKKAREKLDATQKDLLQLLTPEQEAVLVRLGYLD